MDDVIGEGAQGRQVGRHGMIAVVAREDLPKAVCLFGGGLAPAPSQFVLGEPGPRRGAIAPDLPLGQEALLAESGADEGETQQGEGLRLAEPAPRASGRSHAAEFDGCNSWAPSSVVSRCTGERSNRKLDGQRAAPPNRSQLVSVYATQARDT